MPIETVEELERLILAQLEGSENGCTADELIQGVRASRDASETTVLQVIWHLIDQGRIQPTPDRKLRASLAGSMPS